MEKAISIAKQSGEDIPVGAVIVKDEKIISIAVNTKEKNNDVTSHAEIIAIRQAEQVLNNWRLEDCDMYVTLEPCPMCGWAILQSRIKNLYFGSYDYTYGAFFSKIDLRKLTNSKLQVYGGIMENECDKILEDYFKKIRK
jgi:tRNA(adenine34) deaminase